VRGVVGLLCLITLACREIQTPFESQSVKGYQFSGIVTTDNGYRLPGVNVSLYFWYDKISETLTDTQQVIVTDVMQIVDISVFTLKYDLVRTIYFDRRSQTGPLPRFYWDGKDDNKELVASGMYLIRYYVGDSTIKYSPVVVDGHVTAESDGDGMFTIGNDNLPIGKRFDYYDSTGTFKGVNIILPKITLKLQRYDRGSKYGKIELMKDKITRGTFIL
jgi:hypothetical protein